MTGARRPGRPDDGSGTAPAPASRRWWIDRLRVTVIGAVIAVHAATAYVVPISWYYEERTTSDVTPVLLGRPVELLAAFGLSPLFLVAGVLAAGSLARRGPAAYAATRLLRLGVPAVVYVVILDPVVRWIVARAEGYDRPLTAELTDLGNGRGFGPLWFVVALLGFSLLYAGGRWLRPASPGPAETIGGGPLLLVGASIAVLDLLTWPRVPGAIDRYLDFDWPHWQQAAGVFVLGVLAGERGWFDRMPASLVRSCGRLALLMVAGLTVLTATSIPGGAGPAASGWWQGVLIALLDGGTAVVLMIWLVDRVQTTWSTRPTELTARAARGSYAAYVFHPVVLVALSVALRTTGWAPEVKALLVAVVGVPAAFLVGSLVARLPGVRRLL